MKNEAVSEAGSVPDQVGDTRRAKHAGSHMVEPIGAAALCHWRIDSHMQSEGFDLSVEWGKQKTLHDVG